MTEIDIHSGPDYQLSGHNEPPRKRAFEDILYAQGPTCISLADYTAIALFIAAALCLAIGLSY